MHYTEEIVETPVSAYEIERDKPMPSKHHAIIQGNINFLLRLLYGNAFRVLSEIRIKFPIRDRIPDLAIYQPMAYGEEEVKMTEIPLGVVEILSPTQSHEELETKRKEYFVHGVQSYWLVLPDLKSVYVFRSPDDYAVYSRNETLKDSVLGIEIDLAEVFK